jgi:hypothetical protein
VLAGIVAWNDVTVGGEPLLNPGSPKYLAALLISAGAKGARNAATCTLLVAVPSVLMVNVTLMQTGDAEVFVNVCVL